MLAGGNAHPHFHRISCVFPFFEKSLLKKNFARVSLIFNVEDSGQVAWPGLSLQTPGAQRNE